MPEATGPLVGRRILLVEDEYLIVEAMEGWLVQAGATVVGPAPGVDEALRIIVDEADGLDGAVLDVNLGEGETAYPIADRLAQLGVPYLFATGDVRTSDNPTHQGRPRLEKPVSRAELLRAVASLLVAHPA
jgi:CheY-like chemotaxis protein